MKYLDRILNENGEVLAIILREKYSQNGIEFFTPDDFPQQLGYMKHKIGHKIKPHLHSSCIIFLETKDNTSSSLTNFPVDIISWSS